MPEWVFCSQTGGHLHGDNVERTWLRVRRKAQKKGVRPLKLHTTRHTYASVALDAGKSIRWVAEQLGHANPELTLRVYGHLIRDREEDLTFAEFAPTGATGRPYTAPPSDDRTHLDDEGSLSGGSLGEKVEHETGLEPATSTLATWCSTN